MNTAVFVDAYESAVFCIYIADVRSCGIAVDVCEGGALIERTFSNACYSVANGDRGEGGYTVA